MKKLLFTFEGNYERSQDLAFLVSNHFPNYVDYKSLDHKIDEYIEKYKDLAPAPTQAQETQRFLLLDEDNNSESVGDLIDFFGEPV